MKVGFTLAVVGGWAAEKKECIHKRYIVPTDGGFAPKFGRSIGCAAILKAVVRSLIGRCRS
jgi:hypothetical protein